eukprot:590325-Ditylum_brightwellii.AAC.1
MVKAIFDDDAKYDADNKIIDIPKVKLECLQKVIEFCEKYVKNPLNPIMHTMEADSFDKIVANIIMGKSVEDIQSIHNISKMKSKEEEKARREH